MNGIDKITERIKNDAQREINAAAAETKARCAQIAAEYKEKAQSAYWGIVVEGKKEAERVLELRKSSAQTDSKKRMLQLRQEMVAEAFKKAEAKLRALEGDEYAAFLVSLAVQASETGKEKLVLNEKDTAAYGAKVCEGANKLLAEKGRTAELTLSEKPRAIDGGLILSSGKIETNCSISTLVELRRNELAGEVCKLLFD